MKELKKIEIKMVLPIQSEKMKILYLKMGTSLELIKELKESEIKMVLPLQSQNLQILFLITIELYFVIDGIFCTNNQKNNSNKIKNIVKKE